VLQDVFAWNPLDVISGHKNLIALRKESCASARSTRVIVEGFCPNAHELA